MTAVSVTAVLVGLALGAAHGWFSAQRAVTIRWAALQVGWGLAVLVVFVLFARGLSSGEASTWAAGSVGVASGVGLVLVTRNRTHAH